VHKFLRLMVKRNGGIGSLAAPAAAATAAPAAAAPAAVPAAGGEFKSAKVFDLIKKRVESQGTALVSKVRRMQCALRQADARRQMNAIYQFNVTNAAGAQKTWLVDLKNGAGSVTEGSGKADTTLTVKDDDFVAMNTGKLDSQMAFMQGASGAIRFVYEVMSSSHSARCVVQAS
jgi:hypothetical protein